MSSLEEQIRELISERYGSVPKFARAVGLPAQTIYSALRNGISNITLTTALPISTNLSLDLEQLASGRLMPKDDAGPCTQVPLYEKLLATVDNKQIANELHPIPQTLHESHPKAFLLKVEGESMNRILPSGCYALVDPCTTIDRANAPYAVAIGDGFATVKRARALNNGIELLPDSTDPTFRPETYDFGDTEAQPVTVLGRVIWYCIPTTWDFN